MPETPAWQRHETDEYGDHDPHACYACAAGQEVKTTCRCGNCCRYQIIEVRPEDAEREPKIKELGSPVLEDPQFTESGEPELIGYLLNRHTKDSHACVFLDEETAICTIYETRPLLCRLFDCDDPQERARMIELGLIERDDS